MPGYEVTLVDPPTPGFLCRECSLLLRDPVQTEDGERLCRSCRDLIKKTGVSKSEIKPEVQVSLSIDSIGYVSILSMV